MSSELWAPLHSSAINLPYNRCFFENFAKWLLQCAFSSYQFQTLFWCLLPIYVHSRSLVRVFLSLRRLIGVGKSTFGGLVYQFWSILLGYRYCIGLLSVKIVHHLLWDRVKSLCIQKFETIWMRLSYIHLLGQTKAIFFFYSFWQNHILEHQQESITDYSYDGNARTL